VAACTLLVRKPVRIALTMEEQFYTITKHGATVRLKTGVKKDGRMVAREVETWWNGGAYADIGPRVTQKSGLTSSGPYDIENSAIDSHAIYTNEPPAGALRGFGISQVVWAYESQADIIARALKIDPLEFRRRNILREGRPHATGMPMTDVDIDAILDRLADRMDWHRPFDRGSGTIRRAAEDARAQLLLIAAAALKTDDADIGKLECRDGVVITPTGARMTFREVMVSRFAMQAGNIIGVGSFIPPYEKPDHDTGQSRQ